MLDKSVLKTVAGDNTSAQEIARFDKLAKSWWDPDGQYKRVLDFNACRWQVIEQQISGFAAGKSVQQLSALDVGCGGGLLCEPMAKMGLNVTGIDASQMSIGVAQQHARMSKLEIQYRHCLSSDLLKEGKQFDIVLNTEVIEHVPDQQQLMGECCALLKPGGLMVLATLNRTVKSFVFGIVGAEYVLRLLPIGTHSWRAFVKPSEMQLMMEQHGCRVTKNVGISYNPLTKKWRAGSDLSVNYVQFAHK